ncbi:MAG: hypothetical protein ACOCV1_00780 [Bacillota bacterium]
MSKKRTTLMTKAAIAYAILNELDKKNEREKEEKREKEISKKFIDRLFDDIDEY